jgi:alpha-ribazole phosphatase
VRFSVLDIYLVRHTRTANRPGLCYGRQDIPLAPDYQTDFDNVRKKLPHLAGRPVVFSSPLSRCRQLAEALFDEIQIDERLLELNFGDWENRFFDELDTDLVKAWSQNFVNCAPPNGESFTDLCLRAAHFWQYLLTLQAETIILFTHAGVIRGLLAHILKMPPANTFSLRIGFGSVHKIECRNDYAYVDYLNR